MKELTILQLDEEITNEFIENDKGPKFVINNSKYVKEIIARNHSEVLIITGKYLIKKRDKINNSNESTMERTKNGWIQIIAKIVEKNKIDVGREIFGNDFDKWITWASELDPNKIVYLE